MKSRAIIVVLSILLILSLGAATFFGYKYFEKSNEGKESSNSNQNTVVEEKEESEDSKITEFDNTTAKKLIDNLYQSSMFVYSCNALEIFTNSSKVAAKDISNQIAFNIGKSEFVDANLNYNSSVTLAEMTSAVQKHLGKSYSFNPAVVNDNADSCGGYVYDAATATFNYKKNEQGGCGGVCAYSTSFVVDNSYVKGNILTVNVKVIFADLKTYSYYSDYARTSVIGDYDNYDLTYFDKGSSYQFNFELEDGNYVFVSSGLLAN